MRVWAVSFFVLFGLIEIIQWAQGLQVPFATYVIIGVLLAIASNADKWSPLLPKAAIAPKIAVPESPSLDVQPESMAMPPVAASPRRYYPGAQLSDADLNAPSPISFTIKSPQSQIDKPQIDKPQMDKPQAEP